MVFVNFGIKYTQLNRVITSIIQVKCLILTCTVYASGNVPNHLNLRNKSRNIFFFIITYMCMFWILHNVWIRCHFTPRPMRLNLVNEVQLNDLSTLMLNYVFSLFLFSLQRQTTSTCCGGSSFIQSSEASSKGGMTYIRDLVLLVYDNVIKSNCFWPTGR